MLDQQSHKDGESFLAKVLTVKTKLTPDEFVFHKPDKVKNPRGEKFQFAYIEFLGKKSATNKNKSYNDIVARGISVFKPTKQQGFAKACLYVDLSTIKERDLESHLSVKLNESNKKEKDQVVAMSKVFLAGLRKVLRESKNDKFTTDVPLLEDRPTNSSLLIKTKENRIYAVHGTEKSKDQLLTAVCAFLKTKQVKCEHIGKSIRFVEDENSPLTKQEQLPASKSPKAQAKAKAAPKEKTKAAPKMKEGDLKINLLVTLSEAQEMHVLKKVSIDKIKKARPELFKTDSCNQVLDHIDNNFVMISKDSAFAKELKYVKTVKQIKRELSKARP